MYEVIALQPQIWIIPVIAGIILAISFVLIFPIDKRFGDHGIYNDYMGGFRIVGIALLVIGSIVGVLSILLFIPFDSKYQVIYKMSGEVTSVSNSFVDGSGNITGDSVITLSGHPNEQIVVANYAIVTLKGSTVDLTCTTQWVPYAQDIQNCIISDVK